MKRKRSYSGEAKRAAVRVLESGRKVAKSSGSHSISPYQLASHAAGGASKATVYRWLHEDLCDEAIEERLSQRGISAKFTVEQDSLMVGYAIHRRLHLKTVCRDDIIKFARHYLNVTPRPQYISELLNKHGLTLQVTRARNSRMTSEEVVLDAIATVLEIRQYGFPPDRIIIMDETGLWSNVVKQRTYHFRNWFARSISKFLFEFGKISPLQFVESLTLQTRLDFPLG